MSNNLGKLRKEFKLTQADLAKILNTSTTNIGYYEQEKRDFKTKLLETLASFFMVSIDYLLGFSDSGIKIHFDGDKIIEYTINEEMLKRLKSLDAVFYKDDSFKRYLDVNKLFGISHDLELSSLMSSINTLDDLKVIDAFPLESKDDLDRLYSIMKIKELDKKKAHAIKKILELL